VSLTDRDQKMLVAIVPILLIAAYLFLVLAPKRDEASKAADELSKQEQRRDAAQAKVDGASQAKTSFRDDYTEIVRVGKAIPAQVDMPSLLVQLDRAADGTGIRFTRVATGAREGATTAPSSAQTGAAPAQAGGAAAASGPGSAVESANNTQQTSDQKSAAAEQSGLSGSDTQTSASARQGGLPVGGGETNGSAPAAGGAPTGLETVPLELGFVGDFFHLADFFHQVKRFVRVANSTVVVNGRLITIDGVRWSSDPNLFPRIKAELTATVYLSPKSEGAAAGATPQGPAPSQSTPVSGGSTAQASTPPIATATP
jgi:hypothetical protein